MAAMAIPDKIGKYEILRELGQGATSTVYHGRDPFARRDVALKLFSAAALTDPERSKRFHKLLMNEAAMVGKLNHPHIIDILDAVITPEQSYIVMEYVDGTTLEDHAVPEGLLPQDQVVEILFKCCQALDYACRHGVIHRDIKPANILMTHDGRVKISDFGAALLPKTDQTQLLGVGSPAYMSPEQVKENPLTHQTDIYSLGVVMFKLLTGHLPFTAENNFTLIYKILNDDPPELTDLRPDVSLPLARIAQKAMQKDLSARYASWGAFADDLAKTVAHLNLPREVISDTEKFNNLRSLAFFRDFEDVELWEVLRISAWRRFQPGAFLIHEGDVGQSFFILADGQVQVLKGDKPLGILGPGESFGEMSYLRHGQHPRTASVITVAPSTLIKIKAEALTQASENCQLRFNRTFLDILVDRLDAANERIAGSARQ